ncbi:MAG TPA: class I SAM-dependent methyltransferase [Gemmatimonadaceae bacterium]
MPLFAQKIEEFDSPIALPETAEENERWQKANRGWWESQPMRYDWNDQLDVPEYSPAYFREIDRRFFDAVRAMMPWRRIPFDDVIDFYDLRTKEVLEIGVGCGTHAQLIASHSRSFTGIDITEFATSCTRERMACFGIPATIMQMDAENLSFPDDTFDFIWSWGVIHHSANTRRILEEIHRVLRPGGRAVTMVYHRNFWNYYVISGLFRGVLAGGFRHTRSLNALLQRQTDGALARHYTEEEWYQLVADLFTVDWSRIYGMKVELLPLPAGKIKAAVAEVIPDSLGRVLTNDAKLGTFLVTSLTKRRA